MDANNIISAPQIDGVKAVYDKWKENHTGSLNSFYDFMTIPTPERDDFISSLNHQTTFNGSVASVTVKI